MQHAVGNIMLTVETAYDLTVRKLAFITTSSDMFFRNNKTEGNSQLEFNHVRFCLYEVQTSSYQ